MTMHGIIYQFAEETAFLYSQRSNAVGAPHFTFHDLARLDERLDAQIDGLRVAGAAALEICKGAFHSRYAEEMFGPAVLALENCDQPRIREALAAAGRDRAKARVLVSALGWLSCERADPHLKSLLADASSFSRYIGIAASADRRRDPGLHLVKAAFDAEPSLKARALRAYGELGRSRELTPGELRGHLTDQDDEIRFSAAWSAALVGNAAAVETLRSFVDPGSPYRDQAMKVALRRMGQSAALSWLKRLAQSPGTIRLAVIGSGMLGDSDLVSWLIEQMQTSSLARVAGEAFTMITGADLALEELKGARPEGFEAGPSDDPADDNVAMDEDGDLPWPDEASIGAWWTRHKGALPGGIRCLLGKPLKEDHLRQVLLTGRQRQRAAAALELAMIDPSQPLFDVRAPAFRQKMGGRNR